MKKLSEHNKETFKHLAKKLYGEWIKAGVECDECDSELEMNNEIALTSDPLLRSKVRCPNCDFIGSMY